MAQLRAAGTIIFLNRQDETLFLVLRSRKHGEWGPPKGHAENGESPIETALRETYEESGLRKIKVIRDFRVRLRYKVKRKGKRRSKEVVYFLCRMPTSRIRLSEEHTHARMVTLDEVKDLIRHKNTRLVFKKAHKHIKKKLKKRGKKRG